MVTKPSTARGSGFMLAAQFQMKKKRKKKTPMAETLDSIKNVDHIMAGY